MSDSSIETSVSKILHLVQNFIWNNLMFVESWKLQIIFSLGSCMKAYDDINYIYSISDLHMLYIKLALSSLYEAGVPINSSLL